MWSVQTSQCAGKLYCNNRRCSKADVVSFSGSLGRDDRALDSSRKAIRGVLVARHTNSLSDTDASLTPPHHYQQKPIQMTDRQLISSGSPFEAQIGYSRAVVQGDFIFVSGCTGSASFPLLHSSLALITRSCSGTTTPSPISPLPSSPKPPNACITSDQPSRKQAQAWPISSVSGTFSQTGTTFLPSGRYCRNIWEM